jgi:predicted RNase H-like HicB family nuclease
MTRNRNRTANEREHRRRVFDFRVIPLPVADELTSLSGYQVTVPLLPGVITYGRTEEAAIEMARGAIRCHLDGLRKSGEDILDENRAQAAKLRVALGA